MLRIHSSSFIAAVAAGVVALLLPSHVRADERDQLTYFTFSAPVEVPGAALPAGTYMFKLADPDSDRSLIRVLSKDGTHVYSTFFAIPYERATAPDEPVVTFEETPSGTPEAVGMWFYPGDRTGYEFVYPKDQANRIGPVSTARTAPAEPSDELVSRSMR